MERASMNNRLFLRIEQLVKEGDEDYAPAWEPWGRLEIALQPADGSVREIIAGEWTLGHLAEWLVDNVAHLCGEPLDVDGRGPRPGESLAAAYERLMEENLPTGQDWPHTAEQDRIDTLLYQYSSHHVIRFGLPWAERFPRIMVGCNGGSSEISLAQGDTAWAYPFDMERFLADLWPELRRFLEAWRSNTRQDWARARADALLARLGDPPQDCCNA